MHPRLITLLPVVALLAVPLACSSGSSGTSGAGAGNGSLSKSAFASKSNAYCVQASAARDKVSKGVPSGAQPTAQDADKVIAIDRTLIRQIDDLTPPDSEQDQVDAFLQTLHDRLAIEDQLSASIAKGTSSTDPTAVQLGNQIATIDKQTAKIATPLGLTSCIRQGA